MKLNQTFQQTSSELQAANVQMSACMNQIDALNQQTADMQKSADLQRQDFEREIEKLRREQAEMMRQLKSQPLEFPTSGGNSKTNRIL